MIKCKRCGYNEGLIEINDYEYQWEEEDDIEIISILKCPICNCIHGEKDGVNFYEYQKSIHDFDIIKKLDWKI